VQINPNFQNNLDKSAFFGEGLNSNTTKSNIDKTELTSAMEKNNFSITYAFTVFNFLSATILATYAPEMITVTNINAQPIQANASQFFNVPVTLCPLM